LLIDVLSDGTHANNERRQKMKIRKMLAGLLLVLGIVVFGVTNASAVEANYTGTINRIGGYAGANGPQYVFLNLGGAYTNLQCRIPDGRLNQTMAVLLTAASNGATVFVRVDPALPVTDRLLKIVYYNVD
jgi:hypothetical protein